MFFRQKTTSLTDAELIARFRESSDLSLVADLFGRYTTMIYGVCVKYLKNRDVAKDAAMQVFEKLPHALKNHEIVNFRSWVYVTARNLCLMQLRAKKGKFTQELDADGVENELALHLEGDSGLDDDLEKMEKCIDELADEQKRCVRLFFLEEKCYREIVTMTGFSFNQVKSYIQNGKRNLKICMERNA